MLPVEPFMLLAFIPAALALNFRSGADMMFCLGQGLRGGPRTGMAANVGIAAGAMVHTLLAGLGLRALAAAQPLAFEAIRWLGVGYPVLAGAAGAARGALDPRAAAEARPMVQVFREALVVNLLNLKVILFVLAFLPQFVDPARPVLPQFLTLGAVFCAGGLVVNGLVGCLAGGIGRRLAGSGAGVRWLGRASAAIFAGLAVRLALMQRG